MSSLARLGTATLLGVATWVAAGSALAQEGNALGSKGSFVLSLEHLGGYSNQRLEFEGSDAVTNQQFGLFTPFLGPFGSHARLGLHYFVAPPISIGGLLSYSDNDYFGTFLMVGARVGAALPVSGSTSIWLRGGIAYARTSLDFGGTTQSYTAILPGGEVLLAFKPLDHFGLLLGGMFEASVSGTAELERDPCSSTDPSPCTQERDFEQRELGLTFGAFIDF
ncbi:MAG: outer membrane beta-barrel protein [Polyangiaceae bacterium]|nr:outer membrane beta-barrel protein [Polyangiaceae bacterium]